MTFEASIKRSCELATYRLLEIWHNINVQKRLVEWAIPMSASVVWATKFANICASYQLLATFRWRCQCGKQIHFRIDCVFFFSVISLCIQCLVVARLKRSTAYPLQRKRGGHVDIRTGEWRWLVGWTSRHHSCWYPTIRANEIGAYGLFDGRSETSNRSRIRSRCSQNVRIHRVLTPASRYMCHLPTVSYSMGSVKVRFKLARLNISISSTLYRTENPQWGVSTYPL